MSSAILKGVVHGKTIELEHDTGLADGQQVSVQVQIVEEPPRWLDRFTVDPSIVLGKLLVKGTRLLAQEVKTGRSDEELRRMYPELTQEDVEALQQYVRVPAGLRHAFGAWAEDGEELDRFLEELRLLRKLPRRGIDA